MSKVLNNIKNYGANIKQSHILLCFIALAILITAQNWLLGDKQFADGGPFYTHYNNYIIFRQSLFHLLDGKNLYLFYDTEYWDLYKYSPSFPIIFAPIFLLPVFPGLLLWNILNTTVLAWAISNVKVLQQQKLLAVLLFIIIETITSTQNSQSNALMAALLIGGYNYLERNDPNKAAVLISISFFIKIFGGFGFLLFLFYKPDIKKIISAILIFVTLGLLPLLVINTNQFVYLYHEWLKLLLFDHDASLGFSVLGFCKAWLNIEPDKLYTLIAGLCLLLLPLLNYKRLTNSYVVLNYLSLILVWLVIFNHKAESPTFIVAAVGAALWYFAKEKPSTLDTVLIVSCFILGSLTPTDLFPKFIRINYLQPMVVKVIPFIVLFLKILAELLFIKEAQPQPFIK